MTTPIRDPNAGQPPLLPRRAIRLSLQIWLILAIAAWVLAPGVLSAQVQAKPKRAIMVPRNIRGKAVQSQVINGVVLVFGELADTDEVSTTGDGQVELPRKPKERVELFSGSFDEIIYGSGSSAADALYRLDRCLQEKLDKIDRISELTEVQRQKLQLAGRGDLKRLFVRTGKLGALCDRYAEIDDVNQFQKWTEDLRREATALRQPLANGPLETGSLLAKCMKTVLTDEQAAKYARYESTPPYQAPERRSLGLEGVFELRDR
jgi:hypothetical protein